VAALSEFAHHPAEHSFLTCSTPRDENLSPGKVVGAPDWRMFLMRPADVERELLRLHQSRALEYQVAGSLQLPAVRHLANTRSGWPHERPSTASSTFSSPS
jgi:hypothetical protein